MHICHYYLLFEIIIIMSTPEQRTNYALWRGKKRARVVGDDSFLDGSATKKQRVDAALNPLKERGEAHVLNHPEDCYEKKNLLMCLVEKKNPADADTLENYCKAYYSNKRRGYLIIDCHHKGRGKKCFGSPHFHLLLECSPSENTTRIKTHILGTMLGISPNVQSLSELASQWRVEVAFNAVKSTPYTGIIRYLKAGYYSKKPCKEDMRFKGEKMGRMFKHGCVDSDDTERNEGVLAELEAIHNEEHSDCADPAPDAEGVQVSPERTDNRYNQFQSYINKYGPMMYNDATRVIPVSDACVFFNFKDADRKVYDLQVARYIEKELPKLKWYELYEKWGTVTEEFPYISEDELFKQIRMINSVLTFQDVSPAHFAREVVGILSKSKGKKNTIWIHGEGNAGKSFIISAIGRMMCFHGDLSQSKNFSMQSLVGKTFFHFEDLDVEKMGSKNFKTYKDLLEGNPTTVDVKYVYPVKVQAPVIVTSNTTIDELLAAMKYENDCSKRAFKLRMSEFSFPNPWHNPYREQIHPVAMKKFLIDNAGTGDDQAAQPLFPTVSPSSTKPVYFMNKDGDIVELDKENPLDISQ